MLCGSGRKLLAGMELADSLSLDPHKWLFQPFETGCLLLRNGRLLRDTFHILPDYLKDSEPAQEEINYRDHGIQLTRSFRALKLWMSLKAFGLEAFRQGVAHGIGLSEYAESRLRQSDRWEIVTPAQLGIVTFRVRSGDTTHADATARRLVEEMFDEGFAMLSTTVLHGRLALRFCTINPRTTEDDIRETIERLERKI
jgi:glutamate/tyrosine decarboxylase-like PLP-dependent enzyme